MYQKRGQEMNFITIMNQVLIIFVILIIGFASRKREFLTNEVTKGLSKLLMGVILPFNIVSSFTQKLPGDVLLNAGKIFVLALFIHIFSIVLGMLLYRNFENNTKKVLWFITVFSNCGFMGFPVLESIFGKTGVFYGAVYVVAVNLIQFSFGQMIFTGEKDLKALKKALINPGVMAVFIGLLIFILPFKPPFVAIKVLDMVGSVTTPLAMMIVGSMLAEVNISEIFSGFYMYYASAIRLVALPGLILLFLKAIGIRGDVFAVCGILTAMPAAANTVIFAEQYNGDSILASKIVFVSTVLSIVTIPLIATLLPS